MPESLDIFNAAVSLLVRATLLATRFSGHVRKRSLKRLADRDTDAKAKEILFLKDIDHFSRKLVRVVPLEGPNAGWIIEAMEQAVQRHGTVRRSLDRHRLFHSRASFLQSMFHRFFSFS